MGESEVTEKGKVIGVGVGVGVGENDGEAVAVGVGDEVAGWAGVAGTAGTAGVAGWATEVGVGVRVNDPEAGFGVIDGVSGWDTEEMGENGLDGDAGIAGIAGVAGVAGVARWYCGTSLTDFNSWPLGYQLNSLSLIQNTFLKKSGSSLTAWSPGVSIQRSLPLSSLSDSKP